VRRHFAFALTLAVAGATALGSVAPIALGKAGKRGPTAAEIRAAVHRAERSRDLWATVNVCKKKDTQDIIGIRGQMPSLGFATSMSLDVQVEFWSRDNARFEPIPGAVQHVRLGTAAHTVLQGGASFKFQPPAGELRGVVTFEWKRGRKVLARATRKTTHGHKHVDFADPPGYSAGICTLS
jgi:hypothetical protein